MLRVFDSWLAGLKPSTRANYGANLRRLLSDSGVTAEEALANVKAEYPRFDTYSRLRMTANRYSDTVKRNAVFALHSYLLAGGVQILPRARITKARLTKPRVSMTWDEANAIVSAANKPYNLVLKMMLYCSWGIGEFLRFNTHETWDDVKKYLSSKPNAEYYRYDFTGRKKDVNQWYSLIPTALLRDVVANCDVPFTAKYGLTLSVDEQGKKRKYKTDGILLDYAHYHSARTYIEIAFRTALRRAPVRLRGRPPPHELRDTFRTRAAKVECARDAAEFAMGHDIDPLGYNKIFNDEEWVWSQLKKIYGPTLVTDTELEALRKKVRILEEKHLDREQIVEIFRDFLAKERQ